MTMPEVTSAGVYPDTAEILLDKYYLEWGGSIEPIFDERAFF